MFVIGTTLGPYRILDKLGQGGMGVVYRAQDTRLGREVAIKVLPEAVATDASRLSRFEREAQVLASLNHPHIGAIYGLEESEGVRALVLELVEGPTLADQLANGPLPVAEAIAVARQIAEALEAAHDAGIVHRDLKPANVKLRPDGTVKVLDFGLAKAQGGQSAASSASASQDPSQSPTLTDHVTEAGIILGTAAYMAPEQARGKAVDKRADIWAFGVLLYESLTGSRLFESGTTGDTLAAVLTKSPDYRALPRSTPASVRQLLVRCLERDPRARLRDMGEARLVLANPSGTSVAFAPAVDAADAGSRWRPRRIPWDLVAAALALGIVWLIATRTAFRPAESHLAIFDVAPPPDTRVAVSTRPSLALSPDGTALAFVAVEGSTSRLYVRRRDQAEAYALDGTEGASDPAFSPDGRYLAYVAGTSVLRIPVQGGPPTAIADVNDPRGLAWLDNETLIVATIPVGGLSTISLDGRPPTALTTPDRATGDRTDRWPSVIPGRNAVLYTVGTFSSPDDYDGGRIDVLDLASNRRTTLVRGARMARYVPGHLLFARGGVVFGVRFNPDTLQVEGTPTAVIEGVAGDRSTGASDFAYASDGTLAYVPGSADPVHPQATWYDATGHGQPVFGLPQGGKMDPSLSPDGGKVAFAASTGAGSDIWLFDFAHGAATRLTFGGINRTPVWSRDGRLIYFAAVDPSGDRTTVFVKPADGGQAARKVTEADQRAYLHQVVPGRGLLASFIPAYSHGVVAFLPTEPGGRTIMESASTADEVQPAVSPDGRWLAYSSDESSRDEIYVRDLGGAGRWQVSTTGGNEPRWSADGRRLFFRRGTSLLAADVSVSPTFRVSKPAVVFSGPFDFRSDSGVTYGVDGAHDRFLMMNVGDGASRSSVIRVALHWDHQLRHLLQPSP